MTHLMGLTDHRGRHHFRSGDGKLNRTLKNPDDTTRRLDPHEISLRGLAESVLGENWDRQMGKVRAWLQLRELFESDPTNEGRTVLEDDGAGAIMPSAFANINAFTAVASGLLEVGILEAYESPEFIADQLAPVEPSKQFEGRKTIGAARLGDVAEERLPGMPTKRVQFGERWLTQPRTVENSLACELTQEAVYLDLTGGQVTEHANSVGDWLAYRKELRVIDSFIGTGQESGAPGYNIYLFNYKGTSYNPFAAAGALYDNDITSGNELLYRANIQAAEIKFRDMVDPETATRIRVTPNTMLVNREKFYVAEDLFTADKVEFRDSPGATSGDKATRYGNNALKGKYRVLESPLVFERCDAADGLNLSTAASGTIWWLFESGTRTHSYIQNWPLRTQTAAPNQVDMIDRGLVLFVKADERGIPMWKDPRRVVRNKA